MVFSLPLCADERAFQWVEQNKVTKCRLWITFSSRVLFGGVILNMKSKPSIVLTSVLIACDVSTVSLAAFSCELAAKP